MMIPLKWILIYEAIVSVIGIIAALVIVFYKRRNVIERQQRYDDQYLQHIYIHNTDHYEHYTCVDYSGRECDHVISFKEFYDTWIKHYLGSCHDFTPDGFQYDEGGSMGFDNVDVGFATRRDIICYRRWFNEQLAVSRSALRETMI